MIMMRPIEKTICNFQSSDERKNLAIVSHFEKQLQRMIERHPWNDIFVDIVIDFCDVVGVVGVVVVKSSDVIDDFGWFLCILRTEK